jgi:hypothetical protein
LTSAQIRIHLAYIVSDIKRCDHKRIGKMTNQDKVFDKSVTFRMEEGDYKEIQRIAQESDVSIAWVLRYAVKQFLEARPKQLKLL